MRRRDVLAILGAASVVTPLAAHAQRLPVIGFLSVTSSDAQAENMAAVHKGLGEAGYVEGRNVVIEFRWANNQLDRLPEFAADLVRRKVDVIFASGGVASAQAAKAATASIPIVFTNSQDPVAMGLVASLNRPGGNLTGATFLASELAPKRLGLLAELVPGAARYGVLVDPNAP